jgi:hypothetical protein
LPSLGADVTDRGRAAGSARPRPRPRPARAAGRALALPQQAANGQLVTTAGSAVVSAARVGRLLGRAGWRIAKQLPGMSAVEQQADRLRHAAAAEMLRLLEIPQQLFGTASPEEQRVMMLVRNAHTDPAPLRSAMSELLHRSVQSSRTSSREYLFGTIVSQLVPDEARILAALAGHGPFAALDVVVKPGGRAPTRAVFANASTVGTAAGIALARNTPTYLTRLHGFGLVEFGAPNDELADDYRRLADDDAVREARRQAEKGRKGSVRLNRKTVTLSALGREFWTATAPEPGR